MQIVFNGKNTRIYTIKRFGLDSFLFEMSKLYEIIVFTASQKLYASRIIDMIDPKNRITHRLYREHCRIVNKTYFLKDIRTLGRNTKDIIIVDVRLALFRTTTSQDCCSLRTSIRLSPSKETKKTGNYAGSQLFSSTYMTNNILAV